MRSAQRRLAEEVTLLVHGGDHWLAASVLMLLSYEIHMAQTLVQCEICVSKVLPLASFVKFHYCNFDTKCIPRSNCLHVTVFNIYLAAQDQF